MDSIGAAANIVYKRTQLSYVPSKHTSHTPYLVHQFHFYPPVYVPGIFTYGKSDPTSPSHDSAVEIMTPKLNCT